MKNNATFHLSSIHFDWRAFFMSLTSICNRRRIFFSSSNSESNCLISFFCWSFMVSMMVRSSLICVLSSSRAVWPWLKCSVFGFPSVPNRDGEFDLWPVVPIAIEWNPGDGEGDSDGCTLLPLARPPGFGGKEVLLSDTCDIVTVLDFLDTSRVLWVMETCSSFSSSGLGESKKSGLERDEDVRDWEGGRLPVAFGLVVVGWLSFSAIGITESKPSKS